MTASMHLYSIRIGDTNWMVREHTLHEAVLRLRQRRGYDINPRVSDCRQVDAPRNARTILV